MPPMLRESYAGVARQTAPVPGKKAPAYTEFLEQGREFLTEVYGQTQAQHIEDALYTMSPRLGHYAVPLVYGGVYADTTALSIREACVLMFMCNMAVDTPKQAIGHIDSSRRQGATKGDLLNVGIMVRSIAEMYNVKLTKWELIMETVDTDVVNDRNPYEV
ncbi:Putative uncharacterized protein [Taphrina deformans PYCC 5710]|uniref:Carboxymuconolactone decarboxylase-like domain-containing protein n=1 Tax=Taphrina deformans (strain PYCC 5710 / ATCC 11124 / CBS 356.35 / IMI 108563 / JCM 9778 / NBRC 8474) TaxID=1097556 RepID=R4X6D6_TAPDE|nr:Putative uncharacterized protein [Taphrina deformans PYCC 5710]|eukprot:CCG80629.1 Putative uncharacterized protein [Taphrina deformans PYCC 5710]